MCFSYTPFPFLFLCLVLIMTVWKMIVGEVMDDYNLNTGIICIVILFTSTLNDFKKIYTNTDGMMGLPAHLTVVGINK